MPREVIHTDKAPAAIGPYSQAVKAGGFLFVSGQIPLDPATGEVVPGPIEAQARQVMENLRAILAAEGLEMSRVVKTTIYLANLEHFAAVNEVYAEAFQEPFPARACIQVAALPKGARIEIEAVARA